MTIGSRFPLLTLQVPDEAIVRERCLRNRAQGLPGCWVMPDYQELSGEPVEAAEADTAKSTRP